jgi:hypothetical protein
MPNLDSPRDVIFVLADRWFTLKTELEINLGAPDLLLHVGGGLFLQLVMAVLLRCKLSCVWPWITVFATQLLNEAADLYWGGMHGEGSLAASSLDTAYTMLLPTALLFFCRRETAPARTR